MNAGESYYKWVRILCIFLVQLTLLAMSMWTFPICTSRFMFVWWELNSHQSLCQYFNPWVVSMVPDKIPLTSIHYKTNPISGAGEEGSGLRAPPICPEDIRLIPSSNIQNGIILLTSLTGDSSLVLGFISWLHYIEKWDSCHPNSGKKQLIYNHFNLNGVDTNFYDANL